MDIWFALFIAAVALAAATGFSLALVGYINVIPAAFAAGRNWVLAVAAIPLAVFAIPVGVVYILAPVADLMAPAPLARWLAVPALAIHAVGLIRFLAVHWQGNAKTGKQLGGGLALTGLAAGFLYGAGPLFAERIVASVK